MRDFLLVVFCFLGLLPCSLASEEKKEERLTIMITGTFDGYGDRPTNEYKATIPVVRPTLRYGLIKSTSIDGGTWQPEVGMGFSIAIGEEDLRDSEGWFLETGESYRCLFREIEPVDGGQRYEVTFVRVKGAGE